MIKKFLLGLVIGTSLGIAPLAFAQATWSSSPTLLNAHYPITITPACGLSHRWNLYTQMQGQQNLPALYSGLSCVTPFTIPANTFSVDSQFLSIAYNTISLSNASTIAFNSLYSSPEYFADYKTFDIIPLLPSERPANFGFAVLGGTAPSVGVPLTGTTITASVADSAQTTVKGLAPVLEIVLGLLLAFIVIEWSITTLKKTDKTRV